GAAASMGLGVVAAQAQPGRVPGTMNHYYVPATDKTVHWGYFSKLLKPLVEVSSGDFVTIEVLTHHANDDAERMVKGDPGAESVFYWDRQRKGVDRRGAGPMHPTLFGRGPGEGLGERNWAKALYNFQWTPQTDPYGVVHKTIDYPGVPVDHRTVKENHGILKNVRIPIRPHFGVLGLAPSEADIVDSIPPHWVGGNI